MWFLKSVNGDDYNFVLCVGQKYWIGRLNCEIIIPSDKSISRQHAILEASHNEGNLSSPHKVAALTVSDKSKFGTSVNGSPLNGTTRQLVSGDEILFGTGSSLFKAIYKPLVVTMSCLDSPVKKEMKEIIQNLGGHVVSDWRKDCDLLIMSYLSITAKAICALISQKSIVTPQYLKDTKIAAESKTKLPLADDYIPLLTETTIQSSDVSFLKNEKRLNIFQGKTFIFLSTKQFKTMNLAVDLAGGVPILMEEQADNNDDNILIEPGTCVLHCDPNDSTQNLSQHAQDWVKRVKTILDRHGKRMISQAEVGYAVLYCSLERYCNPDADQASSQNVTMTQTNRKCNSNGESSKRTNQLRSNTIVPETLERSTFDNNETNISSFAAIPESFVENHNSKTLVMETPEREYERNRKSLSTESHTTVPSTLQVTETMDKSYTESRRLSYNGNITTIPETAFSTTLETNQLMNIEIKEEPVSQRNISTTAFPLAGDKRKRSDNEEDFSNGKAIKLLKEGDTATSIRNIEDDKETVCDSLNGKESSQLIQNTIIVAPIESSVVEVNDNRKELDNLKKVTLFGSSSASDKSISERHDVTSYESNTIMKEIVRKGPKTAMIDFSDGDDDDLVRESEQVEQLFSQFDKFDSKKKLPSKKNCLSFDDEFGSGDENDLFSEFDKLDFKKSRHSKNNTDVSIQQKKELAVECLSKSHENPPGKPLSKKDEIVESNESKQSNGSSSKFVNKSKHSSHIKNIISDNGTKVAGSELIIPESDEEEDQPLPISEDHCTNGVMKREIKEEQKSINEKAIACSNRRMQFDRDDDIESMEIKEENVTINEKPVISNSGLQSTHNLKTENLALKSSSAIHDASRGFIGKNHIGTTVSSDIEYDPSLASALVNIQFISLIVRRAPAKSGIINSTSSNLPNFKKFKKNSFAGANCLPRIIGGSDLVAHHRDMARDVEELFKNAVNDTKHRNKADEVADDLFNYESKKFAQKRKR